MNHVGKIPIDKPESILWCREWVAMHMDFQFPEITDAGFQAEVKKLIIEVAGERLYDYRAAEQVERELVTGGHDCPIMKKEAAAEGFTRYSKVLGFIRLQIDAIQALTDEWRAQADPPSLENSGLDLDADLVAIFAERRAERLLHSIKIREDEYARRG